MMNKSFFRVFAFLACISIAFINPVTAESAAQKVVPGGENSSALIYENGNFTRVITDVSIPIRDDFEMAVKRSYNSMNFANESKWYFWDEDSLLDVTDYESFHESAAKFELPYRNSSGIGYGWSSSLGGTLHEVNVYFDRAYLNFGNRSDDSWTSQKDFIAIQLSDVNYKFYKEGTEWKNAVKGNYARLEKIIVDDTFSFVSPLTGATIELAGQRLTGYRLILPNGNYYEFEALFQHKRLDYEYMDFNIIVVQHETTVHNKLWGYALTKSGNVYGDTISYEYESHSGAEVKKFNDEHFYYAGGGSIEMILAQIAYHVISQAINYEYSYGYEQIVPMRPKSITDNYGRKIKINYRKPFGTYSNFTDFENDAVQISQISSIQYKGVNDDPSNDTDWQTITYQYYTSGDKADHLEKVIYPSETGETIEESYDYTAKDSSKADGFNDVGQILSKITTPEALQIDTTYEWHDAQNIKNLSGSELTDYQKRHSRYLLKTKKDSGAGVKTFTWNYTYSSPESYNAYKSSNYGEDSYSFTQATVDSPFGLTTTSLYSNGLKTSESHTGYSKSIQYWDNRLVQVIEETKGDQTTRLSFGPYDAYGNATVITKTGINGTDIVTYTFLHESNPNISDKTIVSTEEFRGANATSRIYTKTFNNGSFVPSSNTLTLGDSTGIETGTIKWIYDYDSNYNLVSIKLPTWTETNKHRILYGYDTNKLYKTSTTYEDVNLTLQTRYNHNTGLITREDDFNYSKVFTYKDNGKLEKIEYFDSDPETTTATDEESYAYDLASRQVSFTNKAGDVHLNTYDGYGRITNKTITYADGGTSDSESFDYAFTTDTPKLEKITNTLSQMGSSKTIITTKDILGRTHSIETNDGTGYSLAYGTESGYAKKTVTDDKGTEIHYYYDNLNNLREVKQVHVKADNTTETLSAAYSYDDFGNLTSANDFNQQETTYSYNDWGLMHTKTSPYETSQTFTYDRNQNLKTHINGKTHTITYSEYDSLRNCGKIAFFDFDNAAKTIDFTFHNNTTVDNAERNANNLPYLVEIKKGGVTEYKAEYAYKYDGNTRYINYTAPYSNTIKYTYNDHGQISSLIDPKGTTSYSYSNGNRLEQITRGTTKVIAEYNYSDGGVYFGLPKKLTLNSNTSLAYSYYNTADSSLNTNWIQSITAKQGSNTLFSVSYTYDEVGNRNTKSFSGSGQAYSVSYDYDDLYQITKQEYPNMTAGYVYDNGGNRTSYTHPLGSLTYTVTNGKTTGFTSGDTAGSYGFDGNGNTNSRSITHGTTAVKSQLFTYDDFNNLRKIQDTDDNTTNTFYYTYDHLNRRVKTLKGSALVAKYLWGLNNDVIAETDSSGSIHKTFIYTPDGERIAEEYYDGGTKYRFHLNNPLRTPIKIIGDTGNIEGNYEIGSFGNIEFRKGQVNADELNGIIKVNDLSINGFSLGLFQAKNTFVFSGENGIFATPTGAEFSWEPTVSDEELDNHYKLTGHFEEPDLGIYYMGARWYDSVSGRFLSVDPIDSILDDPLSLNPYVYARNNGNVYMDPDGRAFETLLDIASIAFSAYTMYQNPSWANLGWLAWDLAATAIPGAPGSYAVKGAKAIKSSDEIAAITKAALKASNNTDEAYQGVRALSKTLKNNGLSRAKRLEIINSFSEGTIKVKTAGNSQYGLRFFGGKANQNGRYLFETFPASRKSLALDPVWNSMTGLKQFQIRKGATFFEGAAAPQKSVLFNNSSWLTGGQKQLFVPNLGDLF